VKALKAKIVSTRFNEKALDENQLTDFNGKIRGELFVNF